MIIQPEELVKLCQKVMDTCEICNDHSCNRCVKSQEWLENAAVLVSNETTYVDQSDVNESTEYCNQIDQILRNYLKFHGNGMSEEEYVEKVNEINQQEDGQDNWWRE